MILYHRDHEAHERAAIKEYDGNMPREQAEAETAAEIGIICAGCLKRVVVEMGDTECPECTYAVVR